MTLSRNDMYNFFIIQLKKEYKMLCIRTLYFTKYQEYLLQEMLKVYDWDKYFPKVKDVRELTEMEKIPVKTRNMGTEPVVRNLRNRIERCNKAIKKLKEDEQRLVRLNKVTRKQFKTLLIRYNTRLADYLIFTNRRYNLGWNLGAFKVYSARRRVRIPSVSNLRKLKKLGMQIRDFKDETDKADPVTAKGYEYKDLRLLQWFKTKKAMNLFKDMIFTLAKVKKVALKEYDTEANIKSKLTWKP